MEKETSNRLRAAVTASHEENERLVREMNNLQQQLAHLVQEQELFKQLDATRQQQMDLAKNQLTQQQDALKIPNAGETKGSDDTRVEGDKKSPNQGDNGEKQLTDFLAKLVGCVEREMSKRSSPTRSASSGSNSGSDADSTDYDDDSYSDDEDFDSGKNKHRRRFASSLEHMLRGDDSDGGRKEEPPNRIHREGSKPRHSAEFDCDTCNEIFFELKRVVQERDGLLREISRRHDEYQDNMKMLALKAVDDLDHLYGRASTNKVLSTGNGGVGISGNGDEKMRSRTLPSGETLPVVMLQLQRESKNDDGTVNNKLSLPHQKHKVDFHASCAIDTETVEVIKKTEEERTGGGPSSSNATNKKTSTSSSGATTKWWFHDKPSNSIVTVVVDVSRYEDGTHPDMGAISSIDHRSTHTHRLLSSSGGSVGKTNTVKGRHLGRSPSPLAAVRYDKHPAAASPRREFLLSTIPTSGTKVIPRAGSFSDGLHTRGGSYGPSSLTPTRRLMSVSSPVVGGSKPYPLPAAAFGRR